MADAGQRGLGLGMLPAGMRNFNPGNIKYLPTLPYAGVVGPSENTDQGDPQAVFATPEDGMSAAYQLALKKYNAGKRSANALIAGNGGWTPGNTQAAANIAGSAGLSPDEDLNLNDPQSAARFMRGLLRQEHGPASDAYSDDMILGAINGGGGLSSAMGSAGTDRIAARPSRLAGLSQSAIVAELLKRGAITPEQAAAKGYGGAAPTATDATPSWFGEAGRGFRSALGQAPTDILYGAAAPVGAAGFPETAAGMEGLAQSVKPSGLSPGPTVPSMSDIHSLGDVGRYAFGAAGSALGSTVPTLVGGAAGAGAGALVGGVGALPGAVAGAGGTSYLQNTGQLVQDLREQGIDPAASRKWAAVFGAPMAALDVVGLGKVLKIPAREVERAVVGGLARRIASGSFEGAGIEAITEGLQQAVQEATGAMAGGDRPLGERAMNVLENAVQGGIGGGVLGTVGGARTRVAEEPAPVAEPEAAVPAETLALPPPDYKDPVIRPLIDEHNGLIQKAAEMRARVDADPADANAATALQFVTQRADALRGQIANLREAMLTGAPGPGAASEPAPFTPPAPAVAAPQLALPPPDFKDPIIGPVAQQLAAVDDRLGEMQRRAAANPQDANAKRATAFLAGRSSELATQIQNLRQSTVTPPPVAPAIDRTLPTPDWTQPQPDETAMAVFDGETDTGNRVFVRQDGSFRHPGAAPNVGITTPLSELPDRVPSPQEIMDAAKPQRAAPIAPVENPKFVPVDEAAQRTAAADAEKLRARQQADQDELRALAGEYRQYAGADPVKARDSLLGYLRAQGGININAEGGQDVKAALQDRKLASGTLRGVGGITPDEAALRAWQAGYLPGETRPDLHALNEALASDAWLLRPQDQARREEHAALRARMGPAVEAAGVTPQMTPMEAAQRLRDYERGQPGAATEETPPDQRQPVASFDDIPFRKQAEGSDVAELRRAPENAAARATAEQRLGVIARQMFGPQVKIRAADTITAPGEGTAQTSALGMYSAPDGSPDGIIHVAMRAHDQTVAEAAQDKTVYHEGIHHLKAIGAFKPAEWKVLADRAKKEWIDRYGIEGLYPDASPDLKTEEAIAEAFADWRAGERFGGSIDGIFQRIARFFERVSNAARGLGFRTAEDIFGAVSRGERVGSAGISRSQDVLPTPAMATETGDTQGRGATAVAIQPGPSGSGMGPHVSANATGAKSKRLAEDGTAPQGTRASRQNEAPIGLRSPPTPQKVKPPPLGSKLRRVQPGASLGAQIKSAAAARTASAASKAAGRPATIAEALHESESIGAVSNALAKAIGAVKPGVTPSAVSRALDGFRTAVQDNFTPVRRAQEAVSAKRGSDIADREDVYLQQEFYSGRVTDRSERLQREHVAPMLDAIAKAKLTISDVSQYLYARHAPERNARIAAINPKFKPGEGSGMTDEQAAKVMSDIRQSGRLREFERVAALVDTMRGQTLNGLVQDGLLEAGHAAQWQKLYPNYVPLKGFEGENDMADVMPSTSGGFQVRGDESKRAAGRKSEAKDVLENVIMQAQEGIIRGEKNLVFQSLHDLVTANPDPDYWRVNPVQSAPVFNKRTGLIEYRNQAQQEDAKTVWGKVDGQPVRVRLEDPRMLKAIKNLDAERMGGVIRFMAGITRFLSALNTQWSPEFVVSNAFRDIIQSQVTGQKYDIPKFASSMRKNYFKALRGAYGGLGGAEQTEFQKLFQQYSRLGGRVGFAQMESLDAIRARMARELKSHGTDPWQMTKRRAFAIANYIGRTNAAVDNAVRLAAFKTALDAGMTPQRAASIGKNITVNFNRKGNIGPLANAFYMFFNAGVQGNQVLMSAIKGSRKVQKIVGALVAAGAAQELANRMFGGKDDDGEDLYDKIGGNTGSSDFLKSTNAVFMIPGAGKDDWNYIKIPLPYGLNVFWGLGRNIAAAAMGRQSIGRTIGNVTTSAVSAFNPIGGADNLLNLMAPTLIDPLVDIYINQNFTGAPVHPTGTDATLPGSTKGQYWASASQPSVFMARSLNEITGGNQFKPGVVNVNPNDLDHAFGSYAGAAGGLAARLWSSASRAVGLADDPTVPIMQFNEVPFARRVAGTTSPTYDRSIFYERSQQLQIIENQIKGFRQAGDRDAVARVRSENKPLLPLIGMADQTAKDLAAIRKAKSVVKENGTITPDVVSARLDKLNKQEQAILLRFNSRWNQANAMRDAA